MVNMMRNLLLVILFFTSVLAQAVTRDIDIIQSSDHTKVWTPPAVTTTLVGRSSTDTLTNKTLTSPLFTGMTAGSVYFAGALGLLTQDNTTFFWDNTNKRLALGLVGGSPAFKLHIKAESGGDNMLRLEGDGASSHRNYDIGVDSSGFFHFAQNGAGFNLLTADNSGDKLAVGNYGALNASTFGINASAEDNVPLTVRGFASGTSDLQDWQTSTPTTVAKIDSAGAGTFANIIDNGTTASTVPYLDASKQLTSSVVTPTELSYVSNVTSAIQTQLNGKQATGNYITSLTTDVTASGAGAAAATIAANAVTNAKAAQMAAHTYKGNNTGSTANASDLSIAQVNADLGDVLADGSVAFSGNESIGAANAFTRSIANAGTTGTTNNKLAKLTGAPSTAVIAGTSDTGGVVGVVTAGGGTTGSAQIAMSGTVACTFDGATTAGDYVQISATTGGDCHDSGSTYPTSGQVLGRVLSTNGSGGAYNIAIFPAEIQTAGGTASNVVTSSSNNERTERARVSSTCSSSPCTLTSSTSGFSSITRSGTGSYTLNFVNGTFSAAPTCVLTFENFAGFALWDTSQTATAIPLVTRNTSNTNTDSTFHIICEGPH